MNRRIGILSLFCLVGCMHSVESVQSVTKVGAPWVSPPRVELRGFVAHWEPRPAGAWLFLGEQDWCEERRHSRVERTRVVESKASDARWIAVGLAATASVLALRASKDDVDPTRGYTYAGAFGAGAIIVAVVPWMVEKRKLTLLPDEIQLSEPSVVPCLSPRPLGQAPVVVRVGGAEVSGKTDGEGRVFFEGMDPAKVDWVLVDGVVVKPSKPAASDP